MADLMLDRRFPEADAVIPAGMQRRRFQQTVSFYTPSIPFIFDPIGQAIADKIASDQRSAGLSPLTMKIYRSFEIVDLVPEYRWDIDMDFGGPIEPQGTLSLAAPALIFGLWTVAEFQPILIGILAIVALVILGTIIVKPVVEKAPDIGVAIEKAAKGLGNGIFVAAVGIGLAFLAYGYSLRLREGKALS